MVSNCNWKSSSRIVTKQWDMLTYNMSEVPIDFASEKVQGQGRKKCYNARNFH